MNIPYEVVEAAKMAYRETLTDLRLAEGGGFKVSSQVDRALLAALEAAAPHLFAPALALADEMDNVHGSNRGHVTTYQLRQALGATE